MQFSGNLSRYNEEEPILDDGVKVEDENIIDFSGKNNLDIRKYLYESGLQNIFNDYQKSISNLDKNKQKEIEDAYYVRELSKKYLGEYASNQGIGDVSGDLLNIYGSYQDNLNQINENFESLQFGIDNAYTDKKSEYELGLMETEMQIQDVERQQQLTKDLAEIEYNLGLGLFPDGMDSQDYLDSVRDKIGEANYWKLSAENKLVDMNDTMNNAMGKTNDYETQEDWDKYVDELLSSKSINKNQADYMKGMYEVEQNTNFSRLDTSNMSKDMTYYNPDGLGIIEGGKHYQSRNGDYVLSQTENVIDETTALYRELHEKGLNMPYDTPFAHNGKWFVKEVVNSEQVYTEYVKSTSMNSLTNSGVVNKDHANFSEIDKQLGGKDGVVKGANGMVAYRYNQETGEYTSYIDFQTLNVGGEKGNFNINGVDYTIDKKYGQNTGGGIVDLKDQFKRGDWKKGYKDKKGIKPVVDVFIKEYFGGNTQDFAKYVEKRSNGKSPNTVMIAEHNGIYYTINDGELWELKRN